MIMGKKMLFNLDKYADNIALHSTKPMTYRELLEDADSIGAKIKERSLVFILCKNDIESIAGYVGIMRSGSVVTLLDSKINPTFLSNLIDKYKPHYLYLSSNNSFEMDLIHKYKSYVLLKTNFNVDYPINPALALMLTTSGSTGTQKLVRQSYKNIYSNAESIAEYLNIESKDRAITTLPLSYTYGLSIVHSHLLKGASIILNEASTIEKKFWDTLKKYKATTFGGVPFTYEILKKLKFEQMDVPSLKYLTQAGGKLGKELSALFTDICAKKGIKFIVMYGATEATARMSYLPWEFAKDKVGSIGIAIPGGEFFIKDGELMYEGDNVTLGYAEEYSDLSKGDENNGLLRTGDLAKQDSDGFYYIVGRAKRFLKIYGERVNLDEVELRLKNDKCECACLGTDDNLVVYITNQDYNAEIRNVLINKLGINAQAFNIKHINEIPRNEAGKIQYHMLEND